MTQDATNVNQDYDSKYGFHDPEKFIFRAKKGLTQRTVEEISEMKGEPDWMLKYRLKALEHFNRKPMPTWANNDLLGQIDFDNIHYYLKPTEEEGRTWDDVPEDIKNTFDKLGIPEAERKFLAGVSAQYESEVVYHSIREDLEKQGVLFLAMDEGLKQYPELVKKYFGTIIPAADNKFSALNSAVWSGGSFVYVPKNVKVDIPVVGDARNILTELVKFLEHRPRSAWIESMAFHLKASALQTYLPNTWTFIIILKIIFKQR